MLRGLARSFLLVRNTDGEEPCPSKDAKCTGTMACLLDPEHFFRFCLRAASLTPFMFPSWEVMVSGIEAILLCRFLRLAEL